MASILPAPASTLACSPLPLGIADNYISPLIEYATTATLPQLCDRPADASYQVSDELSTVTLTFETEIVHLWVTVPSEAAAQGPALCRAAFERLVQECVWGDGVWGGEVESEGVTYGMEEARDGREVVDKLEWMVKGEEMDGGSGKGSPVQAGMASGVPVQYEAVSGFPAQPSASGSPVQWEAISGYPAQPSASGYPVQYEAVSGFPAQPSASGYPVQYDGAQPSTSGIPDEYDGSEPSAGSSPVQYDGSESSAGSSPVEYDGSESSAGSSPVEYDGSEPASPVEYDGSEPSSPVQYDGSEPSSPVEYDGSEPSSPVQYDGSEPSTNPYPVQYEEVSGSPSVSGSPAVSGYPAHYPPLSPAMPTATFHAHPPPHFYRPSGFVTASWVPAPSGPVSGYPRPPVASGVGSDGPGYFFQRIDRLKGGEGVVEERRPREKWIQG